MLSQLGLSLILIIVVRIVPIVLTPVLHIFRICGDIACSPLLSQAATIVSSPGLTQPVELLKVHYMSASYKAIL